ncbi:MAG: phospho-N-acetylmuramoyl-pentapeptide-transferase [Firmicutes bacterium]|nr:phospho-N-acetylmuramoyl-pentapeptide-transferase [Bacillota bacterium]
MTLELTLLISAFVASLLLGWLIIPLLRRLKIGQTIRDVGPRTHLSKAGTPTMGGLIFALVALILGFVFLPREPAGFVALFATLGFAAVGFADDYLKVVLKQSLGLKARFKLGGQFLVVAFVYLALRNLGVEHVVNIPGVGALELGLFYPLFITVVFVGTSNAVNLTDGVDGLAGGTAVIVLSAQALLAALQGQTDVSIFALLLAGSILGYLVFNLHPARVIMGDTGALGIGGAIAAIAVLTGTELLLVLLGGVFVLVTLSVIIQVASFKLTGRRVFLMSPLHHHFELLGWSEWKICLVFWSFQLVFAGLAILIWFIT